MVSNKESEELPPGWTEHVSLKNGKTAKYFENVATSQMFCSRQALDRYLNSQGGISKGSIPSIVNTDIGRSDDSTSSPMDESVEARRSGGSASGSVYKEVNEQSTGKLTMSEHSESMEDKCHISGEKNGPGNPSLDKGNINESDGLPHGWIKELRPRKSKAKHGPKNDPYYIDPVSGYEFRSKKDVWRYLETGDISKCAIKPRKTDVNEALKGVLSSPLPANVEKKEHSSNTSQLAVADMAEKVSEISKEKEETKLLDENNGVSSPTLTASTKNSKRKPQNVPPRSSKRLSVHDTDANEPTLSAAVNEVATRSSCLSSKVTINGEDTRQLDTEASPNSNVQKITIFATDTNSLFNDEAANEVPQPLNTNIYTESYNSQVNDFDAIGTSVDAIWQSGTEMDLNSTLELLFEEDMDVQPQQTSSLGLGEGNEMTQQNEVDPKFQGDYWSQVCFDFGFNTPAGGMPFEETMEPDFCFQTHDESSSYIPQGEEGGGVGFVVPDMNAPPSFFQNDETLYNLDPLSGANPTSSLSVNASSLPGNSASDSQPPLD